MSYTIVLSTALFLRDKLKPNRYYIFNVLLPIKRMVTDYIIFGIIMLIVLVAGVLIIRKENTKKVTDQRTVWQTLGGIFDYL